MNDETINIVTDALPVLQDASDLIRELANSMQTYFKANGAELEVHTNFYALYLLNVAATRLNGVCDIPTCCESAKAQIIDQFKNVENGDDNAD